mmetsp:Transcript_43555/g.78220  ORF Transcript_43555/g.78220 Transcript_43555/m.78220 type:complete len:188 (-) Transcript_43555:52-615(-)
MARPASMTSMRSRPRLPRATVLVVAVVVMKLGSYCPTRGAYVPPTAAELVPKSPEMMERVKQVKDRGDRLLSAAEAAAMVDDGAMLIDVRTCKQVHTMTDNKIPAKAIIDPVDDWIKNKAPTNAIKYAAEFGRKVIVSCTAGPKSTLAWEFLQEKGIDAYVIDGGFKAWEEAELPVQECKFPASDLK